MQLTTTGAFGGAAILGAIAGFWNYIKIYLSKIRSLFIVSIDINYQLSSAVKMLLQNEFKCSPLGNKNYYGFNEYVRPKQRNQLICVETIPKEPTMWRRGKRFLFVSEENSDIKLTFIRGVFKRDEILKEAVDKFNDAQIDSNWRNTDRFFVRKLYGSIGESNVLRKMSGKDASSEDAEAVPHSDCDKRTTRPIGWSREDLGQPKGKTAVEDMCWSDEMEKAYREAVIWRESEQWFKERRIPWKNGWGFSGAPGCVVAGTEIKVRKKDERGKHIIHEQ